MSFDAIFKTVEKAAAKDPDSIVRKPGDIYISGRVPYGILSGIPMLDLSIGKPGIPAGKVIEYFGFEKTGKSTAGFHAIANAQLMGGSGFFIDTEFAYDEDRMNTVGINTDHNFGMAEADTVEAIFRTIENLLDAIIESKYNKPFVIMVDSITGPESEVNVAKTFGAEPRVGQDARVIRHGMRRIMSKVSRSKATLIFINHAIATADSKPFAKQSISSGGHAIKFYSSLRVQFSGEADIKIGDKRIGQKVYLKIEKLRQYKLEYPKLETKLLNEVGFDTMGGLLDAGEKTDWLSATGEGKKKTYTLGEVEFPVADWPAQIQIMGGLDKAYRMWVDWSLENGKLTQWGGM
jgi:recombination protein RecA